MLFIAINDAAASASSMTASPASSRASASIASSNSALRAAAAEATATPHRCAAVSVTDCITLCRLSFVSRAFSGRRARSDSTALMMLRRSQRLLARAPVARAKLVALQRIESANHFVDVAADRQIVRVHPADDAVRIDDVRHAQRGAGLGMQDSELRGERRRDEDQRRLHILQIGMRNAPGQVRMFVVGAAAEDDGVTVSEIAGLLAELHDLRR